MDIIATSGMSPVIGVLAPRATGFRSRQDSRREGVSKGEVGTALSPHLSDDVVKSLWVRTGGKENKAGIVEGVYS